MIETQWQVPAEDHPFFGYLVFQHPVVGHAIRFHFSPEQHVQRQSRAFKDIPGGRAGKPGYGRGENRKWLGGISLYGGFQAAFNQFRLVSNLPAKMTEKGVPLEWRSYAGLWFNNNLVTFHLSLLSKW